MCVLKLITDFCNETEFLLNVQTLNVRSSDGNYKLSGMRFFLSQISRTGLRTRETIAQLQC